MRPRHLLAAVALLATTALAGTGLAQGIDTVRFLSQETDPDVVRVQRAWVEKFVEENPGTDIILESAPNTVINQRIATYVQAGATLDVIHSDPGSSARLAAAGLLAPIDDVVERLGGRDGFLRNRLLIVDDQVYALNQSAGIPQFHYRKDLFEAAGLEPPETWEELLHAAKALHSDDVAGIALAGGENRMTTIMSTIFVWQNCHDLFDEDLNLIMDHERTAEAAAMYAELLQYAPPDAVSWAFQEPIESFWSGRAAMVLYWHAMDLTYRQNPALIENVGIGPVVGNRMKATQMGARNIAVFKESPTVETGKKWIEFMFTPENAAMLTETSPQLYPPATEGAMEQLRTSEAGSMQAFGDVLFDVHWAADPYAISEILHAGAVDRENCTIRDTNIVNPFIATLWNSNLYARAIQKIAYEGMDPREAVAEAARLLQEQIDVAKAELAQQ
jgi:ABC-type glycerol-3-phosphate transport system substrate-binding protein